MFKNKNHQNKNKKVTVKNQKHVPVLLSEVLQYLAPRQGESYLDVTAGYGGHAQAILEASQANVTLIDRDANAVKQLRTRFNKSRVEIIQSDYLSASQNLLAANKHYDMILADLGVSSQHLNITSRGFSFKNDAPLDMRMDQAQALTAAEIVNSYSSAQLTTILSEYGEEPKAERMTQEIMASRPINSTTQLAAIAKRVWPGYSRAHPATRLFQALRIAVNDELSQLEQALPLWTQLLSPGGRLVVISFHSLEDRIVKQFFQEMGGNVYDSTIKVITKRPVTASKSELVSNPRSRSAKLRVAAKK